MASWKPPLIVAAVSVAIVGGFYLGGPGLGMAVGALCAGSIIVMAVRQVPRGPIVPAPLPDLRRHVLLVAAEPLEDPETVGQIVRLCGNEDPEAATSEVRLLVPLPCRFVDRWSCDRAAGRALAQRHCVLSLASLAKAGLTARAGIGDEDVLLAVEDELRTFPATDVILVAGGEEDEEERTAAELRARLQTDFLHLLVPERAGARAGGRTRVS